MRDRGRQLAKRGHAGDMGKLGLRLVQGFLGVLCVGDVHQRADIFKSIRRIAGGMGHDVNVLHRAARQEHAVFHAPRLLLGRQALQEFLQRRAILGMRTCQYQLDRRLAPAIVLEDTIRFIGPGDLPSFDIPGKAPCAAQDLRLREIGLASA